MTYPQNGKRLKPNTKLKAQTPKAEFVLNHNRLGVCRFERELDTGDENGKCYFYLYWFYSRVFDVLWFWIVSYIAIFIYL